MGCSMAMPEMKCAASPGGTFDSTLLVARVRVNLVQPPHTCRVILRGSALSWGQRGCHAHPGKPDSCAGVTAYCSFVTARYDISCGGVSPEFMCATRACVRRRCGCRAGELDSARRAGRQFCKWSRGL